MKAFQILAIYTPSKDEEKKGEKARFVVNLETILAKDAQSASMIVARKIPEDMIDKLDQIEVAVRPF